jgi:hypothetical protein
MKNVYEECDGVGDLNSLTDFRVMRESIFQSKESGHE